MNNRSQSASIRRNRRPRKAPDAFILFCLLAAVASCVFFVLLPIGHIAWLSIWGESGELNLERLWVMVTGRHVWRTLANSLLLAVTSASIATCMGFTFAFGIHRLGLRGSRVFTYLATLPLLSPPFAISLSTLLLFGRRGLVTYRLLGLADFRIQGMHGLLFVQSLHFFPIAFIILSGVLAGLDKTLEDASEVLGASKWSTFRRITVPLVLPGALSSLLLIMVQSLQDFANPIVLGGRFSVLVTRAYIEVVGLGNIQTGAVLALFLLMPSLLLFTVQRSWIEKHSFVTVSGKPSPSRRTDVNAAVRLLVLLFMILTSGLVVAMYGMVVVGAFTRIWGLDWSLTIERFANVLGRAIQAIRGTAILSITAAVISGVLGILVSYLVTRQKFQGRKVLEGLLLVPFAIPGILVSISYVLAFNQRPFLLTGTGLIVVLALVFKTVPVTIQAGSATLSQVDVAVEEASATLGANRATTFRCIALPLMKYAFAGGLTYSFVYATTAVSSVVLLVSAQWKLLATEILASVEMSLFNDAASFVVILIGLVIVGVGVLQLFTRFVLFGSSYSYLRKRREYNDGTEEL